MSRPTVRPWNAGKVASLERELAELRKQVGVYVPPRPEADPRDADVTRLIDLLYRNLLDFDTERAVAGRRNRTRKAA